MNKRYPTVLVTEQTIWRTDQTDDPSDDDVSDEYRICHVYRYYDQVIQWLNNMKINFHEYGKNIDVDPVTDKWISYHEIHVVMKHLPIIKLRWS